jgi:hypothetical protein
MFLPYHKYYKKKYIFLTDYAHKIYTFSSKTPPNYAADLSADLSADFLTDYAHKINTFSSKTPPQLCRRFVRRFDRSFPY